jgi:hypothetical protein
MQEGRCAGCKHWDVSWGGKGEGAPPYSARQGDEYVTRHLSGRWGDCQRIQHLSGDSHGGPRYVDEPTDDPAFLADGSGYFAALATREDFGCVLFEERDSA